MKKYVGKKSTCSSQEKRKYNRSDRDDKNWSPSPKKKEPNEKRPAIINIIFGGRSGGQSGNKRKALIRKVQHEVNTFYVRPAATLTFTARHSEEISMKVTRGPFTSQTFLFGEKKRRVEKKKN